MLFRSTGGGRRGGAEVGSEGGEAGFRARVEVDVKGSEGAICLRDELVGVGDLLAVHSCREEEGEGDEGNEKKGDVAVVD